MYGRAVIRARALVRRQPSAAFRAEAGLTEASAVQPGASTVGNGWRVPDVPSSPPLRQRPDGLLVSDDETPGFVVHLPVRVRDVETAKRLAHRLSSSLAHVPEVDGGEVTVSAEDAQNWRHRVFCDLRLADRTRCALLYRHSGPCAG